MHAPNTYGALKHSILLEQQHHLARRNCWGDNSGSACSTEKVLLQVVSDMPMHSFLKGQDIDFGGRNCDTGTRGVGGSWTVPTCSTGEKRIPHNSRSFMAFSREC